MSDVTHHPESTADEFEEALVELASDVRQRADRIEGVLRDVQEGAIGRAEARRRVAEVLDETGADSRAVLQVTGGS